MTKGSAVVWKCKQKRLSIHCASDGSYD